MSDDREATHIKRPERWLRLALIVLASVGCLICAVLVQLSVPRDAPTTVFGATVCAPTNKVNCDYVLGSRWAKVGPVPSAAFGMAYFAAVAAWFVVVGTPNRRARHWHLVPLVAVTVGFLASAFFMYLMAFRLPVWCTWCVAVHLVNALVFVLVILAWPTRRADHPDAADVQTAYPSAARAVGVVAFCFVTFLLMIVGSVAYRSQVVALRCKHEYLAVTNNVDYLEWRHRQAPPHDIPIRPDAIAIGDADAPFVVVAFGDFECNKCQAFALSAGGLVDRFGGRLRCVFEQYPVARACNPHAPADFHHFSCEAALAAEAVRTVGTAKQAIDYQMALNRGLHDETIRLDARPYQALAERIGIDPASFATTLQDGAGRDRLADDIALAHSIGVGSTPALFLNGRRLLTWKIVTAGGALDQAQTTALWERLLMESPEAPTSNVAP